MVAQSRKAEMTSQSSRLRKAGRAHGNMKVTKAQWLNAARDILVSRGVGEVKVLTLSEKLSVSRSSFYWYFKDHTALLDDLLAQWEAVNISGLIARCQASADTIGEAICNFFRCFIDPKLFDQRLDFAIREWSRRDDAVRERIDAADARRLEAVISMFKKHGYGDYEADCRGRIIYFMQLGYHALEVNEPMSTRMDRLRGYVESFTGRQPDPKVLEAFQAYALAHRDS